MNKEACEDPSGKSYNSLILPDGHNAFHVMYTLGFLIAAAFAIPVYINSNFLKEFFSESLIGVIYAVGSIVTIVSLMAIPRTLSLFGNYHVMATLMLLEAICTALMAFFQIDWLIAPIFILYIGLFTSLVVNLDVLLECYSDNGNTGSIRAIFLTTQNLAYLFAPAISGLILTNGDYWKVYLVATFLMLAALAVMATHFRTFHDPKYEYTPFLKTLKIAWYDRDIVNIFMANMLLRFFYSWMVIYTPLYLHQELNMDWSSIGIVFTVMLLPFILFQIPAGRLADSKWGEKEFLIGGFIIMGLSTIGMSFISTPTIILWALILFFTRIGASIVEIMTESYFFKHVDADNTNLIGFYRNTRPIAYILGPLIGATIIAITGSYQSMFLLLGVIMFLGVLFSAHIKDTK